MSEAADHIAIVRDFPSLHAAMRARAEQLNISRETIGDLAGLHSGHAGKMLADPPAKNMGIVSFGLILQALGLELVVREDVAQMRRLASRMVQRAGGKGWKRAILKSISPTASEMGKRGARSRMAKFTQEQRSASARVAANARWR